MATTVSGLNILELRSLGACQISCTQKFFSTIADLKTCVSVAISSLAAEILKKVVANTELCMKLLLRQNWENFGILFS